MDGDEVDTRTCMSNIVLFCVDTNMESAEVVFLELLSDSIPRCRPHIVEDDDRESVSCESTHHTAEGTP